ncbi:hypothetical protein CEV34_0026 [Brucella pseudogrignonensis]|uniref:Uncharacterized protein n=1 Tax=Brucella pseudogrignonensis TaxID=419475 RepID=A0A256GUT0_9HYPH|nr:hypothetical protein CEV34_0026 [Brucella pseudogrignonensis]
MVVLFPASSRSFLLPELQMLAMTGSILKNLISSGENAVG